LFRFGVSCSATVVPSHVLVHVGGGDIAVTERAAFEVGLGEVGVVCLAVFTGVCEVPNQRLPVVRRHHSLAGGQVGAGGG